MSRKRYTIKAKLETPAGERWTELGYATEGNGGTLVGTILTLPRDLAAWDGTFALFPRPPREEATTTAPPSVDGGQTDKDIPW